MSKKLLRKRHTGLVTVSALALLMPLTLTNAIAQDASTQPADTKVVVVTGFKKSYADAVKAKRANINFTDSISSDGLGRFPDLNVGEAIQRIPGIQLNRETENRNASINLRGLPGNYARYTINGTAYAEMSLDESTPLGAYNSDIFSAITVVKSPTAADQPGGLTGNIDLQIQPALSRKDGGYFKTSYEYNTLGKRGAPAATISYNKHFSPDFAMFGTVAFSEQNFQRDSVLYNTFSVLKSQQFAGLAATYGTTPIFYPSQIRQFTKLSKGTMLSMSGGAEWRANDQLKFGVVAFSTDRNLDGAFTGMQILNTNTVAASGTNFVTPTGSTFQILENGVMNTYIDSYNYTNASITSSSRVQPVDQKAYGVDFTSEWKTDTWRLATLTSISEGKYTQLETQIDFVTNANVAGNGISGSFNTGGGSFENHVEIINPTPPFGAPTGPFTLSSNLEVLLNAQNAGLQITGTNGWSVNKVNSFQTDVERYFHDGPFSSIQAGIRFESGNYSSIGERVTAQGVRTQNIDANFVQTSPFAAGFFGGTVNGVNHNWVQLNYDYAVGLLKPLAAGPGQTMTSTGWINNSNAAQFLNNNFSTENAIFSTYIQAKFNSEMWGFPVRGNIGTRYEETDVSITSVDRNNASNLVTNTREYKYHNILPSAVIAMDLSQNLVLRAAAYKTFVRPPVRANSPVTIVTSNAGGYNVSIGTSLQPYYATSYDIALEWYNRPNGLVSLNFYSKKITGLIERASDRATLCPADASAWGLGHLSIVGLNCVTDIASTNNIVTASKLVNRDAPLTVDGIEFNVQQNLDFLPAPFNNLGGAFNYAVTKLSGTTTTGAPLILTGVSKTNVNFISYYETKKFGVRLVYNFRDLYNLPGGGTFSGNARSVKARGQWDFSSSYNLNDRVSASLDIFNLSDANRVEIEGTDRKLRRFDYDGRTYQLNIRATF